MYVFRKSIMGLLFNIILGFFLTIVASGIWIVEFNPDPNHIVFKLIMISGFILTLAISFFTGRIKITLENETLNYYKNGKLLETINISNFNCNKRGFSIFPFKDNILEFWREDLETEISLNCSSLSRFEFNKLFKLINTTSINKGVIKLETNRKN